MLAIPNKRCQRPLIGFLTRPEIEALLAAVDCTTWIGRRDYALLLVAIQTGLRLSELTSVRREDVSLGPGSHIHCVGKGRKERGTPLTKVARRVLQAWMKEPRPNESAFLFPSLSGGRLSADAVQDLVNHVAAARLKCPSLVFASAIFGGADWRTRLERLPHTLCGGVGVLPHFCFFGRHFMASKPFKIGGGRPRKIAEKRRNAVALCCAPLRATPPRLKLRLGEMSVMLLAGFLASQTARFRSLQPSVGVAIVKLPRTAPSPFAGYEHLDSSAHSRLP